MIYQALVFHYNLDNTGTRVLHVTDGKIGIDTTTPSEKLQVNGNLRVTGAFLDSNNTTGTPGQVLSSTLVGGVSKTDWIPNLTLTTNFTSGAATLNATTRVLNIPQYSGGGGSTNLNSNPGATDVVIESSSGTNATIAEASATGGTAGVIGAASKAQLDISIGGTTLTQTAPTTIQTVTAGEYATLTPAANTIYIIV